MATWNKTLAIGIPALDAQHRELFDRADALLAALQAGRAEAELERLFWFLDDYCQSHFAEEERLMLEAGFPGLDGQRAAHAEFTEELEDLVDRFRRAGPSPELAEALRRLVSGWLVAHVQGSDLALAGFLAGRAATRVARSG